MPAFAANKNLLLIGASRGLGLALAEEYLKRGWNVVATERDAASSGLRGVAQAGSGQLDVENVDINRPEQVAALHARLASRRFDMLFVNAGVTNAEHETIADVSTDEFLRVMEPLQGLVSPAGTIAIMSSGQGSVANNERGGHEVYRGSKAALNMLMRSYAARHAD